MTDLKIMLTLRVSWKQLREKASPNHEEAGYAMTQLDEEREGSLYLHTHMVAWLLFAAFVLFMVKSRCILPGCPNLEW